MLYIFYFLQTFEDYWIFKPTKALGFLACMKFALRKKFNVRLNPSKILRTDVLPVDACTILAIRSISKPVVLLAVTVLTVEAIYSLPPWTHYLVTAISKVYRDL